MTKAQFFVAKLGRKEHRIVTKYEEMPDNERSYQRQRNTERSTMDHPKQDNIAPCYI